MKETPATMENINFAAINWQQQIMYKIKLELE